MLCWTILPPVTTLTDLLSAKQRCGMISNSRGLPIPQTFSAGEPARQIVLSIRNWSATTRLVVSGSSYPVGALHRGVEGFQVNSDVNMFRFSHSHHNTVRSIKYRAYDNNFRRHRPESKYAIYSIAESINHSIRTYFFVSNANLELRLQIPCY